MHRGRIELLRQHNNYIKTMKTKHMHFSKRQKRKSEDSYFRSVVHLNTMRLGSTRPQKNDGQVAANRDIL